MIDLHAGLRRAQLEDDLQVISRTLRVLREQQRHVPQVGTTSHWSGISRRQFDENLQRIQELWSGALASIEEAEWAIKRTLLELDERGE